MINNSIPSFQSQLRAMLRRNFLIKKRQKGRTFMEIFLPLYFLTFLALVKGLYHNSQFPLDARSQNIPDLFDPYRAMNHTIAIAPDTGEIKFFMQELNHFWISEWKQPLRYRFFESSVTLEKEFQLNEHEFEMAIIFKTRDPFEGSLQYELRTNPVYRASPPTRDLISNDESCRVLQNEFKRHSGFISVETCPAYQYYLSGFVTLQTLLDFTKIKLESAERVSLPKIRIEMIPKAPLPTDNVLNVVITIGLVIALGQVIMYPLVLIVGEKENKVKEIMKIMGLRDSVYWLSWFIIYSVFVFMLSIIATVVLYKLRVFTHTDYFLIFLLILLFSFSVVVMAFMITPFFDKARTAGVLGNFFVNFLSVFYFISLTVSDSSSLSWLFSLVNSSGFAIAFNKALVKDLSGDGVTFANMWSGSGIPFGVSLILLAVDTILYSFLAYYLDSVIPSEYGTKQSPWFLFSSDFWGSSKTKIYHRPEVSEPFEKNSSGDTESLSEEMKGKEAIEIIDMCRTFESCRKPEVKAIDGFNLTIYEGQITAILGHNGAGKTTLFNILTGLTSPTSGTICIYGHDIRDTNGLMRIHQMTGVCPQHDILFELLTPREHLQFFAAIRGVPLSNLKREVEKVLKDVDLEDNADIFSKYLSGGQKRKLSVGIAIIGDPKIIILDEPTAGLDLFSRRHLWSILQNKKHNKVILLTTHYMDEADILADRKAVISKGRLRCCGSSLYLKNKFGIGYRLILLMKNTSEDNTSRITDLVSRYIPKAEYSRRYGNEISFILPHDSVESFAPLFLDIEKEINSQSQDLNISSYGVSMTTLEEVFFQLERNEEEYCGISDLPKTEQASHSINAFLTSQSNINEYNIKNRRSSILQENLETDEIAVEENHILSRTNTESMKLESISYTPNWKQTFVAILKVRFLRLIRDMKLLYNMIIFPLLFSLIGLCALSSTFKDVKVQPLVLNEDTYSTGINIAVHSEVPFLVDSFASHFSYSVQQGQYDGNIYSLPNTTVWMAAIDIKKCCEPSNLAYTIKYNDTLIHSLPIVINSINNAVYRMVQSKSDKTVNSSIKVSTYPLEKNLHSSKHRLAAVPISFCLGLALVITSANLAVDAVYDREIKAKNQLRVNGLTFLTYFGSYCIIFTIIMLVICSGVLSLIFYFQLPFLKDSAYTLILAITLFVFCPSSALFATCLSYFFDKTESAQTILPNISTFLGLIPFMIVVALDSINTGNDTSYIFHLLFSLLDAMYIPFSAFYFTQQTYAQCQLSSCSFFNIEMVTLIVGGILQIPLYFCVLYILDTTHSGGIFSYIFHKTFKSKSKFMIESGETTDVARDESIDVKTERQKVEQYLLEKNTSSHPVIIIQNVRKEYPSDSKKLRKENKAQSSVKVAIKNLTFAVESGEILGLLGHNGAGKTTAIKIITAEEAPTMGKVQVNGSKITSSISEVFSFMGYCPQHDAQWKNITVEEHLKLYSHIRGIPVNKIERVVDSFLVGLKLQEHAKKLSHKCSGGTKRKLSFAMAMIGNPDIVLMDEPSSGMDPYSKRFLWDIIVSNFQGKRGAILTTHSMDEADALCSRVGIMVKGELRCIGSKQYLKNLYGAGYTLEMKLHISKEDDAISLKNRHIALKSFVAHLFSDVSLESEISSRLTYNIPHHAVVSISECFTQLERAKTEFNIEEYSFSQTTLEQVFLKFAIYDCN